MKKSHLKFNVRRLTTCTAIVLAGMLASCSNDDVENKEPEQPVVAEGNTVSLKLISGASQAGRVELVAKTKANDQERKLEYVGKINPPKYQAEKKWSATAIAFDATGTKAYVTWHSDKQVQNQENAATEWGGAVDVVDLTKSVDELTDADITSVHSDVLKFNHVLYDNNTLYLSAASALNAGTVGRIQLNVDPTKIACINFPGVSVNAVAKQGNELVAVSGYTGTYGVFAADVFDQETKEIKVWNNGSEIVGDIKTFSGIENFGGKYVTTEGDKTYVLYTNGGTAKIKVVGEVEGTDLEVELLSSKKQAEVYNYETGSWELSKTEQTYYGKHVFAVKDGIAYVGCGLTDGATKAGLLVYGLEGENKGVIDYKYQNRFATTGVCVDDNYVYAATGNGLRIYCWADAKEGGKVFTEYASEVEEYDANGKPVSEGPASTGTDERHSANFVAVSNGYIYVAYGQSGVRVYKLVK